MPYCKLLHHCQFLGGQRVVTRCHIPGDVAVQARSLAPAIIFVDEIDAVGRIRGGAQGNDERDQTLNQLLSEMDGFSNTAQVCCVPVLQGLYCPILG